MTKGMKMERGSGKKSICIYVTFDQQNIVDAYVGYMLSELRKNMDYLVVVCNGEKITRGKEYILPYADQLFYRGNNGYDAGAFKDALCSLIGWETILDYDELYLINDSFFGPFRNLSGIIAEMEEEPCDFWGLILHNEALSVEYGHISAHIESFFICIKEKLLHDIKFRNYWEIMPFYKNFNDVIRNHEIVFTQYFSEYGYKYAALANTEVNDSKVIENNYTQYMAISYELIAKRNFPFLKRQQLAYNTLNLQTQENIRQAIEYIDKHTNYDVNLIWDNIIRTLDRKALQHSLHLRYIVSDECSNILCMKLAAVLIYANYINACEYVFDYIDRIRTEIDIYVVTDKFDIAHYYRSRNVSVYNDLDIRSIKRDYDFVCMLKDEDMSSDIRPSYINKSHFYGVWNNLIKNVAHISNVITKFYREKRLGFLYPPRPMFAQYFGSKIYGMAGWSRSSLLEELLCCTDIEEMEEKVWQLGYYSGTIENEENASINETNQKYYLETLIDQVRRQYGYFAEFSDMKKFIFKGAFYDFCKLYSPIYIYGTGFMAKQYQDILYIAKGYIVSDGQSNEKEFNGKKIWYLSELKVEKKMGIVVCVDLKYQSQIIASLEQKGIHNYICI